MAKPIDWTKPIMVENYPTMEARFIAELKGLQSRYVIVLRHKDGEEFIIQSNANGECYPYKIINVPPKPREWWVNVYEDVTIIHESRETADRNAGASWLGRLECVHVREVIGDAAE